MKKIINFIANLDINISYLIDVYMRSILFCKYSKMTKTWNGNEYIFIFVWLKRRQAIIWTNANPINWRIYAALGGDELTTW